MHFIYNKCMKLKLAYEIAEANSAPQLAKAINTSTTSVYNWKESGALPSGENRDKLLQMIGIYADDDLIEQALLLRRLRRNGEACIGQELLEKNLTEVEPSIGVKFND